MRTPRDDESEGGAFEGNFAGWSFDSETALVKHIETMQPQEDGGKLQTGDALLLFHLVLQDEEFSRISQPIRCVRKNSHGESKFSAELQDGSWMEIPWQRAMQVFVPRYRESRLDGANKLPAHLTEISDSWETGQILEIRGLREGTTFSMVRSALTHFGQVPYVEVLKIPPGARRSQNDFSGSKDRLFHFEYLEVRNKTGFYHDLYNIFFFVCIFSAVCSCEHSQMWIGFNCELCSAWSAQEIEAPTATARCRFEDTVACCRAAKELKAILHIRFVAKPCQVCAGSSYL